MKRKLWVLAFSLCMVTVPTFASNWVFVVENSSSIYFIDVSSLQKDGDSVTFWSKTNHRQRMSGGVLSEKSQRAVNCRRRETITRYLLTYDDIDNRGQLIWALDPRDKWIPVPPETVLWELLRFVCR